MKNSSAVSSLLTRFVIAAFALSPIAAFADSGFYIGASAGGATLEADFAEDPDLPELPSSIDEDDTAFKAFLGYHFDLPVINLGLEAGYVDFGEPEVDVELLGEQLSLDTSGMNVWGIVGVDIGPVDLFAKLGYLMWEVDLALAGEKLASDDGSDMGYGVGAAIGLVLAADLDGADLSMLSIGIVYQFN